MAGNENDPEAGQGVIGQTGPRRMVSGGAAQGAAPQGWLLLSDREAPLAADLPESLTTGLLVVEFAWPLPSDVLLDWSDGAGRVLSLFHHGAGGLSLLWRDGARMRRHVLPGAIPAEGRLARLLFRWDPGGWTMRLDDGEERTVATTGGLAPLDWPVPALAALCRGQGLRRRDPSVLWFGVTAGLVPPGRSPWIGRAMPVATLAGPVAAGLIRAGDWVLTQDAGPQRVRSVRVLELPSRGSHAPVILRAPWFARGRDLLVSADQMVRIGGPEVEYLFGEDEVLVAAGALADGRSAVKDGRRAMAAGVSIELEGGVRLLDVGGCGVMSGHHGPIATRPILPLRALVDYEAVPLLALLRRMRPSDAA